MGEIIELTHKVSLVAIESSCGHQIYVTERFREARIEDHETFYCSACGTGQCYPAPAVQPPPEEKRTSAQILSILRKL